MTTVKSKPAGAEAAVVSSRPAKPAAESAAPPASVEAVISPLAAAQAEAARTIGEAVIVGKEVIETTVKASTDVAAKGYDHALDLGRGQVAAAVKAQGAAYQGYEEAVALGRDTLEAWIRAGNILTRGLHDLGRAWIGLTQTAIEENVAASKAMLEARTVQEMIDVQADLARTGLERVVGESARLSGETIRLFEQTVTPIGDQVNATLDRLIHPV